MTPANLEDTQRCLELHRYRHLALTDATILKIDRYLQNTQTDFLRDVGHFYLEDITVGPDPVQADQFQGAAPPALEACGCIFGMHSKNETRPDRIGPPTQEPAP